MEGKKRLKYEDAIGTKKTSKFNYKKYMYEFDKFLLTHGFSEGNLNPFWRFFDRYLALNDERLRKDSSNEELQDSMLNCCFYKKSSKLYDRFPTTDKHGIKIPISYSDFKYFIRAVNTYRDFKQKTKFNQLKNLRNDQKKLPIAQYREQITESLKTNCVILIAGDTGCGKSTQVPQYIYETGCKRIVCTQPRRIACIALAKRVAYESLTEYSKTVGYQIRFEKSTNPNTNIIFMTEGLLLRQISEAELFDSYDVIILDEVHERHLYGDFLVGIMKCLLQGRRNFKLILMSATINIKLFSEYFAAENVHIIQVPGRLYPIEIKYRPIKHDMFDKKRKKFNSSPYLEIIQMIDEKYKPHQKGDLLIFLNGISEISNLAEVVKEYAEIKKNWIILQLHSTLSIADQDKVFDYAPDGIRKCIISTNIAETSITIDGIRFVVDSGKVNRMSYNTLGCINQLTEMNISQDSARQRSGRAGRTGPGICYRLYSEEEFVTYDEFTRAEIHLVPLESLVLQMVSFGLADITKFPFLEKPDDSALDNALERLKFYGALATNDDSLALTLLGEVLGKLPVELSVGKMLITSTVFGKVFSVLTLASLLSIQSPFTNQAFQDSGCRDARSPLESNHGDPITLFNCYKQWVRIKQDCNEKKSSRTENSRQWTKKRGIEEQRFYEVTKLVYSFKEILESVNLWHKSSDANLTSAERSMRRGELKQLRSLRDELRNESKDTKRKQLKLQYFDDEDDCAMGNKRDLRDIEFHIMNNRNKVQELLTEISSSSYRELTVLKLLITNGLYPQVAIADEHNSLKSVADSLFHTKNKQFVFLHPQSYFANNIDVLNLNNDEIEVPPPGYFSKRPISQKHNILIYQSLLETKRVYLMNTMRMPAAQTLMLFSKNIHTNETITKLVFDSFVMIDLPYIGQGKNLLIQAINLRNRWMKLLNDKLKNVAAEADVDVLIDDLITYMQTKISCNMKRLLAADLKIIYIGYTKYEDDIPKFNPLDSNYPITCNNKLGGLQVTENVTYDCLIEEEWSINLTNEVNSTPLDCPYCDNSIHGTFLEKTMHEFCCKQLKKENNRKEDVKPTVACPKPNSRTYNCPTCNKVLNLSSTEILRHKKQCHKPD